MSSKIRITINIVLMAAILVVVAVKFMKKSTSQTAAPQTNTADTNTAVAQIRPAIPMLLELGSHNCVPCKAMVPVLAELRKEFDGKLKVEFIDVYESPAKAESYNVSAIPLQIFFDANGKELSRHEGFYAKDDIISEFNDLGINLKK